MEADLDFEGLVFVFVVDVLVGGFDEGGGLFGGRGAEDVAERDVLEAFALADVVVLWVMLVNFYDENGWWELTLGMLIPAGIPLPAKVRTSRLVKSGERNLSFSKSVPQGSLGI